MLYRKKFLITIVCMFLLMVFFPNGSLATNELIDKKVPKKEYQKNSEKASLAKQDNDVVERKINDRRVLVELKEGQRLSVSKLGVTSVPTSSVMKKYNYLVVRIPETVDFNKKLKEIKDDPSVALAEPDYLRELTYTPADPGYTEQWYLDQIQMTQAWDVEKGAPGVTIAVLDSGVNRQHPDLVGRLLPGYDFMNNDADPSDDHGHGTFVTGVIAANANTDGLVGVDLKAKILPIKISNNEGTLSMQNAVEGIYYAINNGADVINMSFGSYHSSDFVRDAIWSAYDEGIVLVASAGNDHSNENFYPASYAPVISVAASGKNDRATEFSNYGHFIDITAPGEKIYSTNYSGGLTRGSGTSFSAPIISGLAGLLKASHPNWSNAQIEWAIEAGADSLDQSEWNIYDGYGRANAYQALTVELPLWKEDAPDKKGLAHTLSSNQSEQEKIDFPMDEDWFSFAVEKRSTVTITIKNSSKAIDLVASLYDANSQVQLIDEGNIGEGEHYTFQAEKGEYVVGLYNYYNHWSESTYGIHVTMERIGDQSNYSDVTRYMHEIEFLTNLGIIRGFPDGTFKPARSVTRLQAVQMVLNEKGINAEKMNAPNPGFTDVTPETYGYKAIAKAVEIGFINGKANGTFNPGGSLTRGQMAAILVSAYGLHGSYDSEFTDVPDGHWAYEVISSLAANNITKGYPDNTFRPNAKVTREHFSVFLYNYLTQ